MELNLKDLFESNIVYHLTPKIPFEVNKDYDYQE